MNFFFMPDNLATHSSIKFSVAPFFLVISVFSHQPRVLHLYCCLQLHPWQCVPDSSQRCTVLVHKDGMCKIPTKYKNIFIMRMCKHWSILPERWCCPHTAWRQSKFERTGFQQPELNGPALSEVLDQMALPVPFQLRLCWDCLKFSKILFPLQSMLEFIGKYAPEATNVCAIKDIECHRCPDK